MMAVWSQNKGMASLGGSRLVKNISGMGLSELLTENLLQMAERKREGDEKRENIKLLKPKKTRNKSELP